MIYLLVLLVSGTVFAEKRASEIILGGNQGPDEFRSQFADLGIGLNEEWLVTGSYYKSESGVGPLTGEELDSTEFRIGADWKFHPEARVYLEGIRRNDPFELKGRGAQLGGSYNLSSLWEGQKRTRLSLSVQELRFEQDVTFTGARASLNVSQSTSQRRGTVSLTQEIARWLEGGLSFTRYNYAGEGDRLNFVTRRRRTVWNGSGPAYGQPDRTGSVSFIVSPWEWLEVSLIGSRTRILGDTDPESRSATVNPVFFYKNFQLGLEYTTTTFTEDSSGTDPDTQAYVGGSFGYSW